MIEKVLMVGASHTGKVRTNNQDSFLVNEHMALGILADGIGGRKGGKTASQMTVDFLEQAFKKINSESALDFSSFLLTQVDAINKSLIDLGNKSETLQGMGTTLELIVLRKNRIYIGHIGDSRTYLFAGNHLWLLTIDHNIRTFLARKIIKKENLQNSYNPSALVKALGLGSECSPDIFEKIVYEDEIYLSATDGLFDMISDEKIFSIIQRNQNRFDLLPDLLIEEALKNGGKDNITVVLCKVLKN